MSQFNQSCTDQEIFQPGFDFISNNPYNDMCDLQLGYFMNSQCPQLPSSTYTEFNPLGFDGHLGNNIPLSDVAIVSGDPLSQLELQPASEENNACSGQLDNGKDLRDGLVGLEKRLEKLEEYIPKLQDQIEEKSRYYSNIEQYIESLMTWSNDCKQAVDNLAAEVKEIAAAMKSK